MLPYWPLAVLGLYFIAIWVVQPADRWVPLSRPPEGYALPYGTTRLLYDDADVAAYVLRAENAARGRLAGRPDEPAIYQPQTFPLQVYANPPLAERYFLEYPPAALYFFRLGWAGSGRTDGPLSSGLLDANQFNTIFFNPRNPATIQEELPNDVPGPITLALPPGVTPPQFSPEIVETHVQFFRASRRAQRIYTALLLLVLAALMLLVARGVGTNGSAAAPLGLWLTPGMLYFSACRYDIIPAALTVAAIAATERRRLLLGGLLLGLAVAFKTYPVVLAPLLLRYAVRDWRQAIAWCAAAAAPGVLLAASLAATDGWVAVLNPLKFQLGRPAEPYWIFFGRLLPEALAYDDIVARLTRSGLVFFGVILMSLRRPPDLDSLLRRCALAVLLFISLQVFYSPQWWQWVAVLLIPLVRTHRYLRLLVVVADVFAYVQFPLYFDLESSNFFPAAVIPTYRDVLVYWRAGLWFCIAVVLAGQELKALRPSGAIPPP